MQLQTVWGFLPTAAKAQTFPFPDLEALAVSVKLGRPSPWGFCSATISAGLILFSGNSTHNDSTMMLAAQAEASVIGRPRCTPPHFKRSVRRKPEPFPGLHHWPSSVSTNCTPCRGPLSSQNAQLFVDLSRHVALWARRLSECPSVQHRIPSVRGRAHQSALRPIPEAVYLCRVWPQDQISKGNIDHLIASGPQHGWSRMPS